MQTIPFLSKDTSNKPVFLKNMKTVWEQHPEFDATNTLLVDDSRYKSLKNDYANCLAVRSYWAAVVNDNFPLYLMHEVLPWLLQWIHDTCPTAYSRKHPMFDVEDDVSPIIASYFVESEGYSYRFDPPDCFDQN